MAKCTCATCGATFTRIEYCYNREAANSYEEWAVENCIECNDCYRERMMREREDANAKVAAESAKMELPELTGSEKQIAWANKLRLEWIDTVSARLKPGSKNYERDSAFIPYVLARATEAKTWIDCRESWKMIVLKYQQDYLLEFETGVTVEEAAAEPAVEVTAPESQKYSGCVEIAQTDTAVEARYVKDEDFRQLVKGLGYEWDGDKKCWALKASFKTGDLRDRVAELGNKLLNSGFAVKIADGEARAKAVSGNYAPMSTRWISKVADKELLSISWQGRDDKIYNAARRLPGSKWANGSVKVPVSDAAEVLDFAEINDFALSPGAKEAISAYLASIKVIKPVVTPAAAEMPDKLKEILSSSREVIDDLKD